MIIIDIETSGLDPRKNGILSIGAVHLESNQQFYIECRLQDDREITPIALKINGFTEDQARDPSKISDIDAMIALCRWSEKLKDNLLGGHNVGHFDILFLEEIWSRVESGLFNGPKPKFPFLYRTIDSCSLGYAIFNNALSLKDLCNELGIEPEPELHNALTGAQKSKEVIVTILNNLRSK